MLEDMGLQSLNSWLRASFILNLPTPVQGQRRHYLYVVAGVFFLIMHICQNKKNSSL
jgi:hypothetical protein